MFQIWLIYFLQHLRLSRNNIFELHGMAFSGLNVLHSLFISHNLLTYAPSLVGVRCTLQVLDLSWNRIISIGDSYFNLCIDIADIDLSMNQITDFPSLRSISKSLVTISLEGNNISLVDPMYGIYFPRLEFLHLGNNQIENYCFPPRQFAPRLSQVYLMNTKLSVIQFSHVNSRAQQAEIFLRDNPWHCNDALGWTKQCVLEKDSVMYCMEWLTVNHMICTIPLAVQGLTPKEAGVDMLCHITHFISLQRFLYSESSGTIPTNKDKLR